MTQPARPGGAPAVGASRRPARRGSAWQAVAPACGAAVAAVGGAYLVAWLRGAMASQGLGGLTMKTNAALCLVLLGAALVLLAWEEPGALRRWAARALAGAAVLVGALTLLENLTAWDLGIDQLLARELPGAVGIVSPNRMGTPGSTGFGLAGIALLLLARRDAREVRASQALSLMVAIIALFPLVGFLYDVQRLHLVARLTAIAWPTALCMLALGVGTLCARPGAGLMAQVTVRDPGGAVIRRLLLPVLLMPVALGAVALGSVRRGILDQAEGTALLVLGFLISLAVLTWRAGRQGSRAAAELSHQRELLAVTLRSIGDALVACDAELRVTFLNAAGVALTGWTVEEVMGRPIGDVFRLVDEETGRPIADVAARVLREGTAVDEGNRTALVTRSGARIPIEDSAAPIRDAAGRLAGAVVVFHDVTEKRRSTEALRESELRFRLALRNAPVWVAAQDRDLRYVWAYDPQGAPPGGIVGRRDDDLFPPEQAARLSALKRRVLDEGVELREQLWLERPGSRAFLDFCWEPIRDGTGQVTGVASAVVDLTPLKLAEAELRRFQLVVEQTRDAILFVRRADGRILEANAAASAIYGYSREELLQLTVRVLRVPDTTPDVDAQMEAADARGVLFETLHRRKDGSAVPVEVSSQGADYAGERTLVSVVRDVTERRRAEASEREQRRQAEHRADELREENRRKNEFLAVLSHELRNPLAPIRNSLHVLARAGPGSEQAGRALEVMERQTRQLGRLVDDLLDVTRVSRGKIRLQRERLDLGEVVRTAGEDHRELFGRERIALEVAVPARPLHADADRARIAQVVGNLLQNAAKFTPSGGRTRLSLEDAGDGRALLEVTDSGAGITPELLAQLFSPFVQGDETLERSRGGLGLGLALVKALVELHGGDVAARSDGPGKGATFSVRLPLAPAEAVRPVPRVAAEEARPARRARILLVEDNEDAAASLKEVLELGGHEVDVAFTGREGVARALATRPDAILCDLGLPELDGFAVVRAVRADPRLRGTLVVALSGYASAEDVDRALAAGFDRHLAKPPDLAVLSGILSAAPAGG